jgi:hypothetical protein
MQYRLTSRKQSGDRYLNEIVEGLQLLEVLDCYARLTERKAQSRRYLTAYIQVSNTSEHAMSADYETVCLDVLADGEGRWFASINRHLVDRSLQLRALDPDMPLLRHRLREFTLGEQVGFGRVYRRTNLPRLPNTTIRMHKSAVLAGDCVGSG